MPPRPKVGIAPSLADAELVLLAVMQALLGFTSEARWLRHVGAHVQHLFPYLPGQSGYNKRLRKLVTTIAWLIRVLARETNGFTDDVWVADSTPVECGRSRETAKRSDLAGFLEYGCCASHSRYFWGLRLHLVCTLSGLPVGAALTGAQADERTVLLDILDDTAPHRGGQTLIADENSSGREFEATLEALKPLHLHPELVRIPFASTQIAVRLPYELVPYLDEAVAAGRVKCRADLVAQLIARDARRQRAEEDPQRLAERGALDDP